MFSPRGGFKASLAVRFTARGEAKKIWESRLESQITQRIIGPVGLGLAYDCELYRDHRGAVVLDITPQKGFVLQGHIGVRLLTDGSPEQIYGRVGVRAEW